MASARKLSEFPDVIVYRADERQCRLEASLSIDNSVSLLHGVLLSHIQGTDAVSNSAGLPGRCDSVDRRGRADGGCDG